MRNKIGVTLLTLAAIAFLIGVFSYTNAFGSAFKSIDLYILSGAAVFFFLACPLLRRATLDGRRS